MTTPLPPVDPLDPRELELARVLRALPGDGPSAALDARILRAAQAAVAEPSTRRRTLWATGGSSGALWGIGSAAAAILAVGIGWKLTVPPDSALPVPRTMPVATDSAADQESTPVDFVEAQRPVADAPGPPPAAVAQAKPTVAEREAREQRRDDSLARKATAATPPLPEAFADAPAESRAKAESNDYGVAPAPASAPLVAPAAPQPELGALSAAPRDARDAYRQRRAEEVAAEAGAAAGTAAAAAPPPPPPPGGELAEEDAAQESLDTIVVTGTRIATESPAQARARVLTDRLLAPAAWLDRIRARWTGGDAAGARASLRLFVERHPGRTVPSDLRSLREE